MHGYELWSEKKYQLLNSTLTFKCN